MGTEIKNTKIILLSAVIFSAFFVAFLVIAVLETKPEKEEGAITVSAPQKSQKTTSGQIAGVLDGPTVVNLTTLDNSGNETK